MSRADWLQVIDDELKAAESRPDTPANRGSLTALDGFKRALRQTPRLKPFAIPLILDMQARQWELTGTENPELRQGARRAVASLRFAASNDKTGAPSCPAQGEST